MWNASVWVVSAPHWILLWINPDYSQIPMASEESLGSSWGKEQCFSITSNKLIFPEKGILVKIRSIAGCFSFHNIFIPNLWTNIGAGEKNVCIAWCRADITLSSLNKSPVMTYYFFYLFALTAVINFKSRHKICISLESALLQAFYVIHTTIKFEIVQKLLPNSNQAVERT